MVWGSHEFAREIHRMLVEIASIKKRVPQLAELLERLERLEASHHNLLRKLGESLGGGKARKNRKASARRAARGELLRAIDRQLRSLAEGSLVESGESRALAAILRRPRVQESKPSLGSPAGQPAGSPGQRAGSPDQLPGADQKCASCGKGILASLFSGEEIVRTKKSWYHRRCFREGKGRGPWLN